MSFCSHRCSLLVLNENVFQTFLMPKGHVQIHRPATGNGVVMRNSFFDKELRYVFAYLLLHPCSSILDELSRAPARYYPTAFVMASAM